MVHDEKEAVMTELSVNRRFELRAYESPSCVRVAALIGSDDRLTRAELRSRWAAAYPRHVGQTGKGRIAYRVSQALSLLRIAGVVEHDDTELWVTNRDRLDMAARNAEIVMDGDGVALPPAQWSRRPEAPGHLASVQDALETSRIRSAFDE